MTGAGAPPLAAALVACARGELSLAHALSVPAEALPALRELAFEVARAGRFDLARALLEGMVDLDPSDRWSLRALAAIALRQGDAQAGGQAAARAAELSRGIGEADPEAAWLLGRAHLAVGDAATAASWLRLASVGPEPSTADAAGALLSRIGA